MVLLPLPAPPALEALPGGSLLGDSGPVSPSTCPVGLFRAQGPGMAMKDNKGAVNDGHEGARPKGKLRPVQNAHRLQIRLINCPMQCVLAFYLGKIHLQLTQSQNMCKAELAQKSLPYQRGLTLTIALHVWVFPSEGRQCSDL